MLLVKTHLANSTIHGIGLFASEFIPAGTKYWEFAGGFDLLLPKSIYFELPEPVQEFLTVHSYLAYECFVVPLDNDRFCNHSDDPNCGGDERWEGITLKDIQAGEEMTCDYRSFDDLAEAKLKGSNVTTATSESNGPDY